MNETKRSGGKAIPKLKEETNATRSVNPSVRKSIAHSGIYFPVLKKPTDVATESRHEQVDTSSILKKNSEPRRAKKGEETLLIPIENLEISTEPAVELFETKTHVDETVESKSVTPHQCQGTCKCSESIKLLQAVCSPQSSTKSELPDVGKDENESRTIFLSKSVRTRNTASDVGKKEKTVSSTRHPVCSELKPQNRRVSKIRPPSDYKCKPASAMSETKRVLFKPRSTTASIPQPTSAPATQPECVSNAAPSSEPTRGSVSSSSSEPTLEGSDADELVSPPEPQSVRASLASSATASELTNMVEAQSSDRPAFWPPSAPTYEIIHSLEPLIVTMSNSLTPLRCKQLSEQKSEPSRATETVPLCLDKPQTSKIAKVPQKWASSSRSSRIPKINPNLVTDTNKVSQKNPSKPQRNLKQTLVKTSISDKRTSTAKTISDSNEQMQKKSTERKQVSQKKSSK